MRETFQGNYELCAAMPGRLGLPGIPLEAAIFYESILSLHICPAHRCLSLPSLYHLRSILSPSPLHDITAARLSSQYATAFVKQTRKILHVYALL